MTSDFHQLWGCSIISQVGSAVGASAIPSIAILILDSSNLSVTLLTTVSGVAGAVIALPLGSFIEFRRKLPIMAHVNLLAFAALLTIPVATWLSVLSYAQLCVVAAVETVCAIIIGSASKRLR